MHCLDRILELFRSCIGRYTKSGRRGILLRLLMLLFVCMLLNIGWNGHIVTCRLFRRRVLLLVLAVLEFYEDNVN
jgi:hypothetical protein